MAGAGQRDLFPDERIAGSMVARRGGPEELAAQFSLQARRMRAIVRLGVAAGGRSTPLLSALLREAPALLGVDGIAVFVDDGSGALRPRAAAGLDGAIWGVALPTTRMQLLAESDGETSEVTEDSLPEVLVAPMQHLLWAPMRGEGRVDGGLLIGSNDPARAYTEDDKLFLAMLAEYLGARLAAARQRQRTEAIQERLVRTARLAATGELAAEMSQRILDAASRVGAGLDALGTAAGTLREPVRILRWAAQALLSLSAAPASGERSGLLDDEPSSARATETVPETGTAASR